MKIISVVLVFVGTGFIATSIFISRKLYSSVQGSYRRKWAVLSGLMGFFLVGYLGYIALQLTDCYFPLELLIGCIFLGGSIFVFIVINLSRATINQLSDFNVKLDERVQERTSALSQSNEALKAAKDVISAEKAKLETANREIVALIKKSYSDFKVRFENKNLLKCWEVKSCDLVECPAHRSDDLRCWNVIGTKCAGGAGGDAVKAVSDCEKCPVYSHISADPISSIGEQFNVLMDKLDYQVYIIEQERERAKQASLGKSQFLANMSHEIRTPMNAIIGFTDLLLTMDIPVKQREYLAMIRTSGYRLLDIINDILDFSRIEAGRYELNEAPFNLNRLIEESMEVLSKKAQEKDLELTYSIPQQGLGEVVGDSGKIRQILVNLVGNAIKFTDKGSVVVQVQDDSALEDAHLEPESVALHFSIIDTGVGISSDQQENIFKSFTQADGSATREFGGTGLGLSISAELARMMNGDLWVESVPGKGSTFHFWVRLKKYTENGKEKTEILGQEDTGSISRDAVLDKASEKNFRILLVDDELINRALAVGVLEDYGCQVEVAENGALAVALVEENNYDLIFMDVQMPVMDGIEATRVLREKEKDTGGHIPIVALTAHAVQGDMEKCMEAGMDAYLSKPFEAKKIYGIINNLVSLHPGTSSMC